MENEIQERTAQTADQKYEIITAISKVYKEISVVDLETGTYTVVSGPAGKLDFEGRTGPLAELESFFLKYNVAADYAAEAKVFLDFGTLPQRLKNREFTARELQGKSGRWFLMTFIVTRRDAQGTVTQTLLTARDVTEQKEKEAEYQESLKRAVAAAEQANEAKANFLRHMSHDIRTPINGIVGLIEMANRDTGNKEKLREYRRKTETALEYLLTLVNNILDMGKLEDQDIELETVPFDLEALFQKNLPVIEMQAGDHDIHLVTDIRVTHTRLIGSPTHLNRILMNLTSNAIKYNRPGGKVTMTCREEPLEGSRSTFVFCCEDTGSGIGESFRKHLFEPFSQEGKEPITTYTGTGLGLPVVKATAERMGGTVHFESVEDVGTTFTVSIPFAFEEEKTPEAPAREQSPEGMRALLVEDNELNLEIAEMLLEDQGLVVTSVRNGLEAVEAFGSSEPNAYDFIFMDIMMPVMDGLEATRRIRALDRPDAKTVAIIAMSANAFDDDIRASLAAGMNAHLTKPVEVAKLHEAILNAISGR